MIKLNIKDKDTLENFRVYLRTRMSRGTSDDYVSHIRKVLEEQHMSSLIELDDPTLNRLMDDYRGDRKGSAIKHFKLFVAEQRLIRDQITEDFFVKPEGLESRLRDIETRCWMYDLFENHLMDLPHPGRPSSPRVLFLYRKKEMTDWLIGALAFIRTRLNKKYQKDLRELEEEIERILKARDIFSHDRELIEPLLSLLDHIINDQNPHQPNRNELFEARRLRRELQSDGIRLIEVLLGEYIDDCRAVVLYLANIRDSADKNNFDRMSRVYATYAHEFFHFFHYQCFYGKLSAKRTWHLPRGFNDHFPGKILKESLASYFEVWFAKKALSKGGDIAKDIKDSWERYSVTSWPYSGAKKIRDEEHFKDIFNETINLGHWDYLYHVAFDLIAD